jgi:3'-phosphoadenosine 5'-phosphosulfate sulfotransferase (PAPS reductase)/FAD synthetase
MTAAPATTRAAVPARAGSAARVTSVSARGTSSPPARIGGGVWPEPPRRHPSATHIVNVSGGKDSAAVALLARESGRPFQLWMADTGNENETTWEYAHYLSRFLGVPLHTARADFSAQIARKRLFVATKWPEQGIPDAVVERALAVLVPTGNPFVDLCIWKGRFPSRKAQFCTEELKANAIEDACVGPALDRGNVVQWLGVRRDESLNRRNSPMFQRVRRADKRGDVLLFRPIIHWTAANVFAFAAHHGLRPNPLYLQGFGRVGCFPCINASKTELAQIGRRYPEAVDRVERWEAAVADASKRGKATFFAPDVTPEGAAIGRRAKARGGMTAAESAAQHWPSASEVFEWAKASRGGRQFDLFTSADDGLSCSSQYGLCE